MGMAAAKTIGDYRVLGRIVHSQAVELYRAQKPGGPVVCIKRLPPNLCDDADLVDRFDREIKLALQLHHPNIVAVYEHGEEDGHYFVMEYVDGMDLGTMIRRTGPLDSDLVIHVAVRLCHAFVYLHHSDRRRIPSGPLVHCDVSPENVLVDRAGRLKLSDFGMARVLPKTGAETITQARGKLSYLSPEQWRGEKLGTKSDLFSLGLVLWYALLGSQPYAEGRPRDRGSLHDWIGERTLANARRPVAEAAPNAPSVLHEVIERLLQPADQRIGTAEEILRDLEALAPTDGERRLAVRAKR
jgi:serine/threonine-protein kinase